MCVVTRVVLEGVDRDPFLLRANKILILRNAGFRRKSSLFRRVNGCASAQFLQVFILYEDKEHESYHIVL